MDEEDIGKQIVDAAIKVHRVLGPGLLESVYEAALAYELNERGLCVQRQKALPVLYEGVDLGIGFRIDLLVEDKVLVELKSVEKMQAVFQKQTLSYLKLGSYRLGFLINFNESLLKTGLFRIVNGLPDARYNPSSLSSRSSRASRDTIL